MRQRWRARRKATANDSNSPKLYRREGYLANVQIKPLMFTRLHCRSAELSSPAKRLPPAGPPEAHTEICAAGAGAGFMPEAVESIAPVRPATPPNGKLLLILSRLDL